MRYYRISEFARLVGVSSATLRVWEKVGKLVPHHKTPSGYRIYSEDQLQAVYSGDFQKQGGSDEG